MPSIAFLDTKSSTCVVNSFSKRFGMTGWRIGWIVGHQETIDIATRAHTLSSLACPTVGQIAAAVALNDPQAELEARGNLLETQHKGAYLHCALSAVPGLLPPGSPPSAGFYLYVNVRELADRLPGAYSTEPAGDAVSRYFLERAKVAMVPGGAFGPSGGDFVRLSYAGRMSSLAEAVHRLVDAVRVL